MAIHARQRGATRVSPRPRGHVTQEGGRVRPVHRQSALLPQYATTPQSRDDVALPQPGQGAGGLAPGSAAYLVGEPSPALTEERVVTDTLTVLWDLATAGQAKAQSRSHLSLPIFSGGGDLVLTNHPNAEQDVQNSVRYRKTLDLDRYQHFRLLGRVVTASASANNPRLYAQYSTDDAAWNALEAAGSSVLTMVATGIKDTGWLSLAAGALVTSIHVRVAQNGGDGVADPAWGYLLFVFRTL